MIEPTSKPRIYEIDLLRFLAALSVIFFHYSFRGYRADNLTTMPYPLLEVPAMYGYLGVEMFFMISGFVILLNTHNRSVFTFLILRISRLYPAFWLCCTLTFICTKFLGAPVYSATFRQYLLNMTMASDFWGVPSIDGVYWSLFIELRFYALVALLLCFRQIHRAEFFLLTWLTIAWLQELSPIRILRDVFLVDFAAYFIAGALCFFIWQQGVS
ncbi:MAG: acyltransferase, partial [Cyanobacteria bacterium P01_H01_bin.15]